MKQLERMLMAIQSQFPRSAHFIRLARLDKPIGIYLLLWPTLGALWIAAGGWPGWHLLLVFILGTVLTRSAGCVMNDIADRNFDGRVRRTMDRPIAHGDIDVSEAVIFMGVLCFLALLLVLSTNLVTLLLAAAGALVAAIYPYMKRYTYMPQAILGIAFSFGIPMAFTAVSNEVTKVTGLLFIANMIWAVAYDSEYAMVDRDDDVKLGLKSSAILFGDMDRLIIGALQLCFLFAQYLIWKIAELHWPFLVGILLAGGLFGFQQFLIRKREREGCFSAFLNNHWLGLVIFVSITVDLFLYP
ncbi:MAG TPA: 4-hydroxybenzoate octaprenyltransferase [Gammaproteobacteria bacterium]|nr:4-hydroxybenzoate octaprenyltransferase [Gammaproteobacteria bacterium]|tara:strand:- start:7100 stop:7999 length:900 start_codon:yes stop_codon:yes gene_type:complete